MPEPRVAGLLGRKRPKPPGERFALRWAHEYLAGKLSTPVYPVNASEGIKTWGMMGNTRFGDCGPAAEVHIEMTTAKAADVAGPTPTDSQLAISRYVRFTGDATPPGPGVTIADYLHWLYQKGIIKAFAPVTLKDLRTQDALMQQGYGVLVGVLLTSAAQTEFSLHQPWGEPANRQIEPTPQLGHCILRIGASGSLDSDESAYVTWGTVQFATRHWDRTCVEEVWLVVTKEEQLAKFTPQLIADIEALEKGTPPMSTTSATRTAVIQQIEQDAEQIEQLVEELVPTTPVTPPATPPATTAPPSTPTTSTSPAVEPPATDTDTPGPHPAATTPAPVPATTAPTPATSTAPTPLPSTTPAPATTATLIEQIEQDAEQIVADDNQLAQHEAAAGNRLTPTGRPAGVPWG